MTNEQLVIRVKAGENVADNMLTLWEQCCDFVKKQANAYIGYAEFDDLMQEGYIALSNAVDHYQADSGVPFINYAAFWIHAGLSRYAKNHNSLHISRLAKDNLLEVRKAKERFLQLYGYEASDGEIISFTGLSKDQYEAVKAAERASQAKSIDTLLDDSDPEGDTLADAIPCAVDVEAEVLDRIQHEQLWKIVNGLPDNQGEIITRHYVHDEEYKQIGEAFGKPWHVVRRLALKGLKQLRQDPKITALDEYIRGKATRGTSVGAFYRNGGSSTELTAIKLLERA